VSRTRGVPVWLRLLLLALLPCLWVSTAGAEPAPLPLVTVQELADGGRTYSLTLQILLLMTVLTLLPSALLMMTSFTRIVIVLAILRQALGTAQTPSNQVLVGLALFLTLFIMAPVFSQVYRDGIAPYLNEQVEAGPALQASWAPFREFMLMQTREEDLATFANILGRDGWEDRQAVPFAVLVSAFITSELRTAFQIGFMIFIPFLIIDLLVASVLMAMGMMMLSPMIVSLPFKLMLFVLVDGWGLIVGTLAASFAMPELAPAALTTPVPGG